ncbi:uncharacterized protein LOC119683540 [Teleopsis dalmanni]|uniref:uncharacterized protein LOC119683540 n=1 Tax=Teleopsis dalmanni TaxID=139649 RepID=UPI0018CC8741|nr:uncharacterized protein LOC119683540 [Teleopsis dalmanni]
MSTFNEWNLEAIQYYKDVKSVKKQLRKENKNYLYHNPEIRAILRVAIAELMKHKPENPGAHLASVFSCKNMPLILFKLNQQIKEVNTILKRKEQSFGIKAVLKERESTHSMLSTASEYSEVVGGLLDFALIFNNYNKKAAAKCKYLKQMRQKK